jgi:signal peptidase II
MTVQTPAPADPALDAHAVTKWGFVAYAVAVVTLVLDQLSKVWILDVLDLPEKFTVPVLPPILNLTMVWNPGVSFGLLRAGGEVGRLLLAAFAAVVVAALAYWARNVGRPMTALGLGLVMGGAVGNNLVDRLRLGHVADFIDVSGLGFFPWVFNVADSAISVGVVLLILDSVLPSVKSTVKSGA